MSHYSAAKPITFLTFALSLLFFSCSKDGDKDRDNLPPVVTLNGNSTVYLSLNQAYNDAGATASDAVDGNVTVTSDITATNPNPDSMGTYTITYTAKDNNGNKGYAYRSVVVQNDAANLSDNYLVNSISSTDTLAYYVNVTLDRNINNRIHFSDLGMYWNNSKIFADYANGTLTIPPQYAINIGVDYGNPCDVGNHLFQSTACTMTTDGFILVYTDEITVPASCATTVTHTATFVRQ